MKFSEQKIDKIISKYADIEINTSILPFIDNTWELLRVAEQKIYSVYIKYPKPKFVNLAIVAQPDHINSIPPHTLEEIKKTEEFLFLFMALMEEVETQISHLTKRQREYIALEAHKKLI